MRATREPTAGPAVPPYPQAASTSALGHDIPETVPRPDSGTVPLRRGHRRVVFGAKFLIRPSGADFHAFAGQRVKSKRRAPAVTQFAVGVDRAMRFVDEHELAS